MPAGVDETRWSKARELARERGRDADWPYVAGIYRRLSGGDGGDVEKTSDESPLRRLLALKASSDRRDYGGKAGMFRALVAERPDEFEPDSLSKGIYGVTHVPTGFRFHIPREAAPATWSDDALWERIGKVAAQKLYHGSPRRLDVLEPRDLHGDPDVPAAIFATPYRQMALAYLGRKWGDADINQGAKGDEDWYLRAMREGADDEVFGRRSGYLYEVPPETFGRVKSRGNRDELISTEPVVPLSRIKVADVRKALEEAGVSLHAYDPSHPDHLAAVKRMRRRADSMEPDKRAGYMEWVARTNPGLAQSIETATP